MVQAFVDHHLAAPGLAQPARLVEEHRTLGTPDPDRHRHLRRGLEDRALGLRLGHIQLQPGVHVGLHQRAQVRQRRDRHHPLDPRAHRLRQQPRCQHARHQVPARRMAREMDRPRDLLRRPAHRRSNLPGDVRDPHIGAEIIGGHRHRPALRQRARGEMRPDRAVEAQPVATVDKNHEPFHLALGEEEIQRLARTRPVGEAAEPPRFGKLCPERLGGRAPARRKVGRTGNMGCIGICVAEIHRHPPFSY